MDKFILTILMVGVRFYPKEWELYYEKNRNSGRLV
jgi:hypothetical protein